MSLGFEQRSLISCLLGVVLTASGILTHKNGMNFHLLMSSSVSFRKVSRFVLYKLFFPLWLIMCLDVLPAICLWTMCMQGPKYSDGSLGTGVTDDCEHHLAAES